MARSSTNDVGEVKNKYLNAIFYREVALERLSRDRGLLSPAYRELLERQVQECDYEIWKKNKPDSILKRANLG